VKKVVWCLLLVLAMPSMALGLEKRDGAYYCTTKFGGGIAYDETLKQWKGATFKPGQSFVMKLTFRDTVKAQDRFGVAHEYDEYDVGITDEGSSSAIPCLAFNGKPPSLTHDPPLFLRDETKVLRCGVLGGYRTQYEFNVGNHRFLKIYTGQYADGGDENSDTPSISGGLCTKISQ